MSTKVRAEARPRHSEQLAWIEVDGEIVVLDLNSSAVHLLSHSAAVLFPLCDGGVTVAELADSVSSAYSIPLAQARDDISAFVRDGLALRIFELDDDGSHLD